MKNKIYLVVTLLALLVAPFAFAGTTEEARLLQFFESGMSPDQQEVATETARVVTNDELFRYIKDEYYQKTIMEGKRLNPFNFTEYAVLAYGARYGTFAIGEYRYLGYTAKKEAYTNVFFRPDFVDGIQINEANWLSTPWDNDIVKRFLEQLKEPKLEENEFNNNPMYRDNILLGFTVLNQLIPDYYRFDYAAAQDRDWEKYVQILQPPSKYCWGTGRMFRQLPGGSIRYMDVPLISFNDAALDFSVRLEKDAYEGKPGEVMKTKATFKLNKEYYKPREANLKLYIETSSGEEIELSFTPIDPAKKIINGKYTFQPGEELEVWVIFTVPGGPAEIVAEIDGTFIKGVTWVEKNSDDNEDRAPIISEQYDLKIELTSDIYNLTRLSSGGGDGANITAVITRKDNLPGDVPANITLHNLTSEPIVIPYTFGPGGQHVINFPMAPFFTTTISGEVWPVGKDDAYPPDNTDSLTLTVTELSIPRGDSGVIPSQINTTKY